MTTVSLDWEDHRDNEVTVGLAAVQINKLTRVVIIRNDFDNKEDRTFRTLINPEIVKTEGEPEYRPEGCLSISGYYGRVKRFPKVKVKALNEHGKAIRITAHDFLARVLQHEIDHINGKTYMHRMDEGSELYKMKDDGKLELLDSDTYEKVMQELL